MGSRKPKLVAWFFPAPWHQHSALKLVLEEGIYKPTLLKETTYNIAKLLNKIAFNTLFVAHVNVILRHIQKNETEGETWIMIAHRKEMTQNNFFF